jgi:membrane protein
MQLSIKKFGTLLKHTLVKWNDRDPFRESAIIAFYAIFSIPGLLLLIITITGYFFDKEIVNQNIIDQISLTMGADTAAQVKMMLTNASQAKSTTLGTILGVGILLIGATGVFVELQKSLNNIWQVKVVKKNGIISILKARLFSFGLIFGIAFLLLISLVVSAALAAMSNWLQQGMHEIGVVLIFIISTLFALMFKILPDAKIKWKHVWLGSLLTGILFTLGKTGLAFYFGNAEPTSIYGAAGSIVLILLWVSYSAMIVFFGAEFTAEYANLYTEKIAPTDIAISTATDENKVIPKL